MTIQTQRKLLKLSFILYSIAAICRIIMYVLDKDQRSFRNLFPAAAALAGMVSSFALLKTAKN